MRIASLAALIATALAACSEAEPPKPAAVPEPPKPVALAPAPAPTPPPAAAPAVSPDEQLAERVKKALRDTRKVEGQGVGVRVAGGTVTLYGTAPTRDERRRIEAFVAEVEGVQAVVSKLVIVRGS